MSEINPCAVVEAEAHRSGVSVAGEIPPAYADTIEINGSTYERRRCTRCIGEVTCGVILLRKKGDNSSRLFRGNDLKASCLLPYGRSRMDEYPPLNTLIQQ
jgi:hypothetical protein